MESMSFLCRTEFANGHAREELTLGLSKITLLNTSLDGLVELVVENGRRRVVEVVVVLNIFLDGLATIANIVLAVRLIAIDERGWSLVQ